MSLDRFEVISILYNTLQNSLKLVKKKDDGKLYTIKSVKVDENNQKDKELFFNELRILVPLTHKNIIWYKEAFYDKETKTLNMVIEYVDGGDLSMKIKMAKEKKLYFKEKVIWRIFLQILDGLNYLHKKYIIHRDLKTSNIYLTKKGIVKITGLNVGKNIEDIGMALTQIGTPYFTAPEIWNQKPYDYKCDIWSLGCILYEMATLHVPFLGLDMKELYQNIINSEYKPIPKIYSKELNEIIKLTLNKNPMDRPFAENLLNNKIVLKKIKELNIKNNIKDESSYINKAVNKIVNDYNNKIKKLENSHIIYKKMENHNDNQPNLKENNKNKAQIHIYTNSNQNIKIENILNNRTNSESNKIVHQNKIQRNNKNKLINNKNLYNNNKDNFSYRESNITEYNTRNNKKYSRSALNQKIYSSVTSKNSGKVINKINNKLFMSINDNYRNYLNKNETKKIDINLSNGNYKNVLNSMNGINIISPNDIYKNNGIKYKNYILNKSIENKPNTNKILIDNNIIKNNSNSFINNNKYYIKINYNNYQKIKKNNNKDDILNNNKKIGTPNYHDQFNLHKNEINNFVENNNLHNKIRNLIIKNNNNIFSNSKCESNNIGYIIPNKLINYNINNIYNNSLKENTMMKKNNKAYIDGKIRLDLSTKFPKTNSNKNMIIKKINNNMNINKLNNSNKKYIHIIKIKNNINNNNLNNLRVTSPMIKKNFNSFIIKNKKGELIYVNPNNKYKNTCIYNTCSSEKTKFLQSKINLEKYYVSSKKKSLKTNNF